MEYICVCVLPFLVCVSCLRQQPPRQKKIGSLEKQSQEPPGNSAAEKMFRFHFLEVSQSQGSSNEALSLIVVMVLPIFLTGVTLNGTDPFLGGIKLDARCMVNLRGVPLSSAFFGLVSYHDPCSTTKNFFGEKEVLPAFHCYIVCWSWVPWVGCRLFWWNLRVSFIIFWRHKVVQ